MNLLSIDPIILTIMAIVVPFLIAIPVGRRFDRVWKRRLDEKIEREVTRQINRDGQGDRD